ncbi:MAG TPA: alpha-ketoglutarate-dependent dioxygenase AlkB [Stellaceae bacterium]|jgi:alkylated DNA repair dioxygenase AlkB|nr:alpha-ketoglutarate-dependent dioxygenase AlkB [Stellaceae bacterium]
MTRRSSAADQIALFAPEPALPPGFAYREDVITVAQERALVERIAELPFRPFEFHGYRGNRRVVSFGWRYDYGARAVAAAAPIPPFLLPLRERAGAIAGLAPECLEHVLVTEYAEGAGIGWHRDKAEFADVVAISLLAPCTLRFRRKRGTGWDRTSRQVVPRSAYLLRGPARHDWEHSIPALDRLRYSVTFRNLAAAPESTRREGSSVSRI